MRQRVDYSYCWLIVVILSLTLSPSLTNAVEQLISDDSTKELIGKSQLRSTDENLNPAADLKTRVNKRASFMPSRGKKEDSEDINVNVRKASSFMPMRGRKDFYAQQQNDWNLPNEYGIDTMNDNDKRAGFMPMRGRKNSAYSDTFGINGDDIYQSELDSVKRSSFMPMRGRKDDAYRGFNVADHYNAGQDEYSMPQPYLPQISRPNWMEGEHVTNEDPELEKKSNAFFGSRGKRSAYSTIGHINQVKAAKRSITSGHQTHNENFFATRG